MSVKYLIKGGKADKVSFTRETRHGEIIYTFRIKDWESEKPMEMRRMAGGIPRMSFFTSKSTRMRRENGQLPG